MEDEIALLNKEAEMDVEQLRKMYANMEGEGEQHQQEEEEEEDEEDEGRVEAQITRLDSDKVSGAPPSPKRQKIKSSPSPTSTSADDALKKLAALDAAARSFKVSRPFTMAHNLKLREYQHMGLNWLVSIQSRRLNGILADEMGLGKTVQTISMLAYLATYKGIWGPHLVVVPTSCLVNWEMEIKKFCPAFKVLNYYGSAKHRKELRTGWTKPNTFHICVTSYQLAVQDSFAFRRKKWYYLILDEAQNIKNFQSQRWQTLVNFNTQRRLLLTGTPLQNNLLELWSLLHFLMPHIFRSRKEFSYWFSNPMNNLVEGNVQRNNDLIKRLHGIIRPFLLRRLKKDVEAQMPGKFEHVIKCQLSRRQMFLYEEFMMRSSTRRSLSQGGNFMGMMNVLMQLRKVCNHPDLFEPRPIMTPFVSTRIGYAVPVEVVKVLRSNPLEVVSKRWTSGFFSCHNLDSMAYGSLLALVPSRESMVVVEDCNIRASNPSEGVVLEVLRRRLEDQWARSRKIEEERVVSQYYINESRVSSCMHKSPYDWRLLRLLTLGLTVLQRAHLLKGEKEECGNVPSR